MFDHDTFKKHSQEIEEWDEKHTRSLQLKSLQTAKRYNTQSRNNL
jgi:hypothetical protein